MGQVAIIASQTGFSLITSPTNQQIIRRPILSKKKKTNQYVGLIEQVHIIPLLQ